MQANYLTGGILAKSEPPGLTPSNGVRTKRWGAVLACKSRLRWAQSRHWRTWIHPSHGQRHGRHGLFNGERIDLVQRHGEQQATRRS